MSHDAEPGDLLERIRRRQSQATAKGGQAYLRLLQLAETQDSGQARRIANFLASTYNAQADLHTLVPDGDRRTRTVIDLWGLRWPEADPN